MSEPSLLEPATVVEPDPSASRLDGRRRRARKGGGESYLRRRAEITAAAAAIFNQRGFKGTSLGAVAAELGIDRATLYYYIGNKEELFDEVVRHATEFNVAHATGIENSDQPAAAKLRALITSLMDSYARNYPLLYIYIREDLNHVAGPRSAWAVHMRGLNKRYEQAAVAIVQQGMDDGSFRSIAPAAIIAFGVLGMVGWTNRWFVPGRRPLTGEQIGEAYADLILAGLQTADSNGSRAGGG